MSHRPINFAFIHHNKAQFCHRKNKNSQYQVLHCRRSSQWMVHLASFELLREMGELWWGTLSGKVLKHFSFIVRYSSYPFAQAPEATAAWVHLHCHIVKSVACRSHHSPVPSAVTCFCGRTELANTSQQCLNLLNLAVVASHKISMNLWLKKDSTCHDASYILY